MASIAHCLPLPDGNHVKKYENNERIVGPSAMAMAVPILTHVLPMRKLDPEV